MSGLEAEFVIPAVQVVSVAVRGKSARFPVRRIYCVGRNYAEHAREMGHDPDRELPVIMVVAGIGETTMVLTVVVMKNPHEAGYSKRERSAAYLPMALRARSSGPRYQKFSTARLATGPCIWPAST